MADDSDDELPTLSAETFAALQQFYTEEGYKQIILEEKEDVSKLNILADKTQEL